jgi:hypothetical protein
MNEFEKGETTYNQPSVELVDLKMKKSGGDYYHPEFPTAKVVLEGPDGREVTVEVTTPELTDMSLLIGIARTAALEAWEDIKFGPDVIEGDGPQ